MCVCKDTGDSLAAAALVGLPPPLAPSLPPSLHSPDTAVLHPLSLSKTRRCATLYSPPTPPPPLDLHNATAPWARRCRWCLAELQPLLCGCSAVPHRPDTHPCQWRSGGGLVEECSWRRAGPRCCCCCCSGAGGSERPCVGSGVCAWAGMTSRLIDRSIEGFDYLKCFRSLLKCQPSRR